MVDELGKSEVVYAPTIIERIVEKPFSPTFFEWLQERGTQIIRGAFGEQDFTLFTVPFGHTFYLYSVSLTTRNFTGTQEAVHSVFLGFEDSGAISSIFLPKGLLHGVSNKEFPIPIKIPAGQVIRLSGDVQSNGSCQIIGYLIKTDAIPPF